MEASLSCASAQERPLWEGRPGVEEVRWGGGARPHWEEASRAEVAARREDRSTGVGCHVMGIAWPHARTSASHG